MTIESESKISPNNAGLGLNIYLLKLETYIQ